MTMKSKLQAARGAQSYTIYLLQARPTTSNVWRCRPRRRRRRRHPNSPGWRCCCGQSQYAHMPDHSTIQRVQLPGLAVSSTWCAQCQWARWRCILLWYEPVEQYTICRGLCTQFWRTVCRQVVDTCTQFLYELVHKPDYKLV